jgi:hypothetical protein
MKNLIAVLCLLFLGIGSAVPAQGQLDLQPVFSSNSIDETLIGLEGGYDFDLGEGVLKPFGGIAYGLKSQKIRHKLGLQIGALSVSHLDWPSGAVLGREGGMGWKLSIRLKEMTTFSFFAGELWQKEGTAPMVGYVHIQSNKTVNFGYGITLNYSSSLLWGAFMPISPESQDKLFHSMQEHLSLSVGQFMLAVDMGKLENKAKLDQFEFVNSVVDLAEVLKGEQFLKFSLQRRFLLLSVPTHLRRPMVWPEDAPWIDEIPVHGVLFVESLQSTHQAADQTSETKNLTGWGLGMEITIIEGVTLDAKLVFDREGKMTVGGVVESLF